MTITDRLANFFLVEHEERSQTGYFILIFLLLGAGLAIGRGSADALFFKRYGFSYLPLMFVLTGVLLAVISTAYAAYADRIPSEKFYVYMLVALIGMLGVTWVLMATNATAHSYPVYYLVYEVASDLLMMHALFYLGQNFETRQAKRLTPLIFAAAQMGKIIGGITLSSTSSLFGVDNMVFLWILLCGASLVLVARRHKRVGVSPYYRSNRRGGHGLKNSVEQLAQGFRFARNSELLRAAAFALFFLVVSYYIICYSVNRIYTTTFQNEETLSMFFGILTAVTAGAALLIQLFVTGKLLRRFGIKKVNLIFPITGMISYLLLIVSFALPAALVASFNKDSLMTAIRNPTRNLFFNALPDYMQGRGRAVLAALVLPLALTVTGGFLHVVRKAENIMIFLVAGFCAATIYVFFSIAMNRAYVRTILSTLRERVFLPEAQMSNVLRGGGKELRQQLEAGVAHDDPAIATMYASLLVKGYPDEALEAILERIQRADRDLSAKLLKIVRQLNLHEHRQVLWEHIGRAEGSYRANLFSLLFVAGDPKARAEVKPLLESRDPEEQAIGIYGVYRYGIPELEEKAQTALDKLISSTDTTNVLIGLDLLGEFPSSKQYSLLTAALDRDEPEIQRAALGAIEKWPEAPGKEWLPKILSLADSDPRDVRVACAKALSRYPEKMVRARLFDMLEDRSPNVRREAVSGLKRIIVDSAEVLMKWVMSNSGSPRAQQSVLDGMERSVVGVNWFIKVAECRIEDARKCRALLSMIQRSDGVVSPEDELVLEVMKERIKQYIDVVLTVMGYLEDPAKMGVIQAGLQSGDSRQVANACEALSELRYQSLAVGLEKIFSFESSSSPRGGTRFSSLADGFEWIIANLDPWAGKVARRALAATG